MRLIEAEPLIEKFEQNRKEIIDIEPEASFAYEIARQALEEAPTVELAPVRHGHWIVPNSFTVSCICSVCGFEFNSYEDDILGYPYCANCGAKMDEETEYDEQRQSLFHR